MSCNATTCPLFSNYRPNNGGLFCGSTIMPAPSNVYCQNLQPTAPGQQCYWAPNVGGNAKYNNSNGFTVPFHGYIATYATTCDDAIKTIQKNLKNAEQQATQVGNIQADGYCSWTDPLKKVVLNQSTTTNNNSLPICN